ncbi:MAG: hypothetical protein ACRD2H_07200 [Terriglobales bacterium]
MAVLAEAADDGALAVGGFDFGTLRLIRFGHDAQAARGCRARGRGRHLPDPGVGVFQRARRQVSKLIYAFKPAPRVKPVLDFVEIAKRTFAREWVALKLLRC